MRGTRPAGPGPARGGGRVGRLVAAGGERVAGDGLERRHVGGGHLGQPVANAGRGRAGEPGLMGLRREVERPGVGEHGGVDSSPAYAATARSAPSGSAASRS